MGVWSAVKFKKSLEGIRATISAATAPFGRSNPPEQKARRERAGKDLRFFAETYFPHYMTAPLSRMHKDMYAQFETMIHEGRDRPGVAKYALAAPRGNAKSTSASLILPLWCICSQAKKFIGILSDTTEQADEFLEFIKVELTANERLREDFPKACGKGRAWKSGHAITANNIKIRCWGTGKALRGARHCSSRPDLVICDDLENDEYVSSPEQRRKTEDWFFKAVMKIGAQNTAYIVVGTILHYDSLLSKLLRQPGWAGKKYKAVIKFSTSPLWEKWERLYAECGVATTPSDSVCHPPLERVGAGIKNKTPLLSKEGCPQGGVVRADQFFSEHKFEMLEGTEVLWPEVEDYHYLMKMRISDGPSAFDSEKQNEPINPDDCLFQENWFRYFDDLSVANNHSRLQYFCAVDPSMGKSSHKADPSAILIGAVREAEGYIDVVEADIQKRHPDAIMEALFEYHKQYKFTRVVIEEVQFQELFKDQLIKEGAKRQIYLPVEGVRPVADKRLRITKLQPHIKNGLIRFRRDQRLLLDQLKYFPKASHDDGPDALEMLFSLIERGAIEPRVRVVN